MKKSVMFFVVMFVVIVVTAQETKKISPLGFAGGLIFSSNSSTSFVGFVGPKLSATFSVVGNIKAEVGVNAFPGLIFLKSETKPGLALGSTLTVKKDSWKFKPVIGLTLLKTQKWQPMFGVGFFF